VPRMCALVGFQFAQPPCGPRSFQLLSTPGQFGGNPRYGAAVTFAAVAASPATTVGIGDARGPCGPRMQCDRQEDHHPRRSSSLRRRTVY
jgi:hypothetical protein